MIVRCGNPECGKRLNIKDELAGRRVRCPACGEPFTVPAAPATEPQQASPPPAQVDLSGMSLDEKIAYFERMVNQEGRQDLAHDLAAGYIVKANELGARDDFDGAGRFLNMTVTLCERLVAEGNRPETEVTLAQALYNRSVMMGKSRLAPMLVSGSYLQAVERYERLVNEQGRTDLEGELVVAYLGAAAAAYQSGSGSLGFSLYDKAIAIRERHVHEKGRTEHAGELAGFYVNRAVALKQMGRADEAVESCDKAIGLCEALQEGTQGGYLEGLLGEPSPGDAPAGPTPPASGALAAQLDRARRTRAEILAEPPPAEAAADGEQVAPPAPQPAAGAAAGRGTLAVTCPKCKSRYAALRPAELPASGRLTAKCPKCGTAFSVAIGAGEPAGPRAAAEADRRTVPRIAIWHGAHGYSFEVPGTGWERVPEMEADRPWDFAMLDRPAGATLLVGYGACPSGLITDVEGRTEAGMAAGQAEALGKWTHTALPPRPAAGGTAYPFLLRGPTPQDVACYALLKDGPERVVRFMTLGDPAVGRAVVETVLDTFSFDPHVLSKRVDATPADERQWPEHMVFWNADRGYSFGVEGTDWEFREDIDDLDMAIQDANTGNLIAVVWVDLHEQVNHAMAYREASPVTAAVMQENTRLLADALAGADQQQRPHCTGVARPGGQIDGRSVHVRELAWPDLHGAVELQTAISHKRYLLVRILARGQPDSARRQFRQVLETFSLQEKFLDRRAPEVMKERRELNSAMICEEHRRDYSRQVRRLIAFGVCCLAWLIVSLYAIHRFPIPAGEPHPSAQHFARSIVLGVFIFPFYSVLFGVWCREGLGCFVLAVMFLFGHVLAPILLVVNLVGFVKARKEFVYWRNLLKPRPDMLARARAVLDRQEE